MVPYSFGKQIWRTKQKWRDLATSCPVQPITIPDVQIIRKRRFFFLKMSKARVLEKILIDLDQDLDKIGKCSVLVQLSPHRVAFERILKEVKAVSPVLSRNGFKNM